MAPKFQKKNTRKNVFHFSGGIRCSSCTYQGWLEHSKQIKKLTTVELDESGRMRESLFVARERVKNALRTQQESTEHVLRKRIFDTQRARNEFEWQIIKASSSDKNSVLSTFSIDCFSLIFLYFLDCRSFAHHRPKKK